MCAFAAFAGMLFGYDSGYISSVLGMSQFKIDYGHPVGREDQNAVPLPYNPRVFVDYSTWQKSLIVSILSAGTFFGALVSGSLADRFGRRSTIIMGCLIFIVGVIVQVAATYVEALVVGRLVAGFGVGFVSAINILYMSEVAPRRVRGAIVSCYQFAITIGIMLASCVGYATQDRQDTGAYRVPIAVQFLWAVVLATGLLMLPESPRYYVKKNDLDRAASALARVRGQAKDSEHILDELAEIQANYEYELDIGEEGWRGCFAGGWKRNSNLRKILIGTMLQFWQQWTGINFIFCKSSWSHTGKRDGNQPARRLQHDLLPDRRPAESLLDLHDHDGRQRLLHAHLLLHHRKVRPSPTAHLGRRRHDRLRVRHCHRRHGI